MRNSMGAAPVRARVGLFASASLFLSVPAAAREIEEVLVTATRTPQPAAETLSAFTLITREQIELLQPRSIEDLLQGTDGLSVANSGGAGKLTSFFVRGTDADQLLVLVDGVRIGSATAGTAALQNIPVEQVERIELVRGPRSSLYGSEAVGGVLQIFTRQGGQGLRPEVSVTGGSFETQQVSAGVGGGDSARWFSLQGSWQQTEGFNACRGSGALFEGCFTDEPDADGSEYWSISARGGMAFGAAGKLDASYLRADSDVEYDGSFTNRSEIVQQVAALSASQKLGNGLTLAARLARAWDESDDFLDQSFQGDFNTTRDSASAQADYAFGPAAMHLLPVGIDYLNDAVDSSTPYTIDERDDTGLFAQYMGTLGAWRIEASLRHDDNQQFGGHDTGSMALGYAISPALQLVAQYGTAFRAPTFNELYYPGFSNPQLEPERSRSADLAAKGAAGMAGWRVSLFETRIDDLIGFDSSFLPANIDEARIRGAEATLSLQGGQWRVESGVTLLDTENRGAGTDAGNELPRRAPLAGHVDLQWSRAGVAAGLRLRAEDDRWDDAANTRKLAGFATLDIHGEYRLSRDWRLQARVANLFDREYETVSWYNQPGRAVYVTLRYAGGAGAAR